MDPLLRSTLLKVAWPVVAISIVLLVSAKRGISRRDDLGLALPKGPALALWIGLWLGWILASEVLIRQLGLEQAPAWLHYPLLILVLRILAIGVLGPIAEELAMRGIVFF